MIRKSIALLIALSLALVACKQEGASDKAAATSGSSQVPMDMQKIMQKPVVVLAVTLSPADTVVRQIEIELYPKEAPKTVTNFVNKVLAKEFDGTTFHRLVPGFVIQGGDPLSKDDDPTNDGYGGERMDVEPRKLSNLRGTVSMASSSRTQPIDSQSDMQFFINLDDKCARLDQMGFIPFGKVVKGMEVVDLIAKQPRDMRDRPLKNITIKSITIKTD